MSSIVDWQDRATCVLFGDGAGACVLSSSTQPNVGILHNILGADGSNPSLLYMPGGGSAQRPTQKSIEERQHYLKMNGKEIFKLAVRVMGQASIEIIEQFGYKSDDLELVIPHQANLRIIESLAKRLNIPMAKFYSNIA